MESFCLYYRMTTGTLGPHVSRCSAYEVPDTGALAFGHREYGTFSENSCIFLLLKMRIIELTQLLFHLWPQGVSSQTLLPIAIKLLSWSEYCVFIFL